MEVKKIKKISELYEKSKKVSKILKEVREIYNLDFISMSGCDAGKYHKEVLIKENIDIVEGVKDVIIDYLETEDIRLKEIIKKL